MPTEKTTYWTSDRIMRLIIGTILATGLIFLIKYLSDVLLPFFAACFIAYLLQPLVEFNRRIMKCKNRVLPTLATLLEISFVIGAIIYMFLPSVVHELDNLGEILRDINSGKIEMPPIYRTAADYIDRYFNPAELRTMLTGDHLMSIINRGSLLIEESFGILFEILSWLLTIIYVLFILIDYPQISRGFKMIVPRQYRPQFLSLFSDVSKSMNSYFRGQGVVALCAVVLYCTGFSIIGLPLAIPMGLMVGILYMIPYFQYVTLVPVTAICFIYSLGGSVELMPMLGKCALVYVISQCICDYVITPHIMGKEMGLNPAVILLSLSVWGSLLGIIGMIIALPVTSLIMTYYSLYISEPRTKRHAAGNENPPS